VEVEWEDLQEAFLSTRMDREYFLDRETGEVVSLAGSDEDLEEREEESEDEENLRAEFENDPDRFVEVTPFPASDRLEWMTSFIQTVKVKDLHARLPEALNSNNPEREFDRILRNHPAERGRWISFMESQAQEIIEGWLEENDIESDTPPPWRPRLRRRPSKKRPGF